MFPNTNRGDNLAIFHLLSTKKSENFDLETSKKIIRLIIQIVFFPLEYFQINLSQRTNGRLAWLISWKKISPLIFFSY